ncbi:Putative F-box domain-containing protein [Septoria linicola]|uniref:F-box domain-containing protein n=1 Tax=Septoria linicola TaxID=215465 RepID=A0A9Q9AQS1_9PEZI|nr:Putative F-box domain-containing protein [Septoria linicola]
MDNTAMAALSFNDLPAELQLNILSSLPAREVQRSRRVCKEWRDVIDLTSNQPLLPKVTESREHVRLKDSFFSIFPADDDDPNTTFLDTIIHFFNAVGFNLYSNRPTEDLVALYWARHILPKRAAATNTPLHHIWEYHKRRGEKGNPPENNNNITAIFSDQAYLQTEICGFDGAGS